MAKSSFRRSIFQGAELGLACAPANLSCTGRQAESQRKIGGLLSRARTGSNSEQPRGLCSRPDPEVLWAEDQVSECVSIQSADEGREGLPENAAQPAAPCDQATIIDGKAFDESEVRFGRPQNVTELDAIRALGQRETARSSANCFQVAGPGQLIRHLHQMVAGDTIQVGCLFDGDQPVALCGSVHQDAQGVV